MKTDECLNRNVGVGKKWEVSWGFGLQTIDLSFPPLRFNPGKILNTKSENDLWQNWFQLQKMFSMVHKIIKMNETQKLLTGMLINNASL